MSRSCSSTNGPPPNPPVVLPDVKAALTPSADTNMWNPLASAPLCSTPRAGHSVVNVGCSVVTDAQEQGEGVNIQCTLLVFGGSDCSGTFYNDTVKCTVEIPGDK